MVLLLLPARNRGTLPYADVEESIHQENYFILHGVDVKKHGRCLTAIQVVLHEGWLDHYERVGHVLTHNQAPVVLTLIG